MYAKADFALCRAGATSIAELTATKTPALFIPYPYAANDHQTANAQNIVDHHGAIMIKENMGSLAEKDAAQKVVAELNKLLQKQR